MDAEILSDRLASTEKHLLQMDKRVDAIDSTAQIAEHDGLHVNHDERLTALEETLAGCIAHLETLQSQISSTEQTIAIAEAEVAKAEALEAVAEAIEAIAEVETAAEPEMAVEEIQPEPELENEAGREKKQPSGNWLERLLALQ